MYATNHQGPGPQANFKSPVLVILPPTHKCADLGRVLRLARKAFGNLTLSIADLNVQFETVSSQELALSDLDDLTPSQLSEHGHPVHNQNQNQNQQAVLPHDQVIAQVQAQSQAHPTPLPSPARSPSIVSITRNRNDVATAATAPEAATTPQTVPRPPPSTAAAPAPEPAAPTSGPLPDAQPSAWRLIVGNLNGSLPTADILANIVPRGMPLAGATFHSPVPAGPGRQDVLVRYVKLAFRNEAEVHACHTWVRQQAEPGGVVDAMIAPGSKLHLGNPIRPVGASSTDAPAPAAGEPVMAAPSPRIPATALAIMPPTRPAPAPKPAAPVASSTPAPTPAAQSPLPEANPKAPHRLTIGNLAEDVTPVQLLSALVPRGVTPLGMTLSPPQQLTGRTDSVRKVQFEFETKHDLQSAYDHIKMHDGAVAQMVAPKTKLVVSGTGIASGPAKSATPTPTPTPPPGPPATASAGADPRAPPAASLADFPEASPSNYRLHISNLQPDLELGHILPALVPPKGVIVVGASMFAPRPMGGSKRDLVRSLKLAFPTEMDAKKCVEWIKKDSGGVVSRIVAKGAKISVGNPMAPMS